MVPRGAKRRSGRGTISIRVAVLGSGSSGNCTFLSTNRARILIDAGFSRREIKKRLASIGESLESIQAVLVTHEHSDHVAGLERLSKKDRIPAYLTARTRAALPPRTELAALETIEAGRPFQIGDLVVEPFTVPHDAADPVGFRLTAEGVRVGLVTDLGYLPENVKHNLRGCHCLVVESNHDLEMLRNGPYPWHVKQRVMERTGHLSNHALSEFLRQEYDGEARVMVLAHLSEHNNHPSLAQMEAAAALQGRSLEAPRLVVSTQKHPTELFQF